MAEQSINEKTGQLNELIENFKTHLSEYKSPNYDEANTRVDYIDKFFELLIIYFPGYLEIVKQKQFLSFCPLDSLLYQYPFLYHHHLVTI